MCTRPLCDLWSQAQAGQGLQSVDILNMLLQANTTHSQWKATDSKLKVSKGGRRAYRWGISQNSAV